MDSDKVCDNCGSGDAVVHLTQITNNEMSTYHLCEKCAAAKGLETAGQINRAKIREIAQTKMPDLNTTDIEAAMKIIEGSARSMGVEVVD